MSHDNLARVEHAPDQNDFADINEQLLRQVRQDDQIILDIGCGNGRFGQKLKTMRMDRVVIGIEVTDDAVAQAGQVLDACYNFNIELEAPPIEPGTLDCIVFGDVLQHMINPMAALQRLKPLLRPSGQIICSIPNVQHFSALASILSGDFQYQPSGLLDANHMRFFGAANIQKMFLDAGFLPNFTEPVRVAMPADMSEAYAPILQHLKLNPAFFADKSSIYQHICVATPMADAPATSGGITFIAAVNNTRQLQDNLLASPIFQNPRHEVIPVAGATSAADALLTGLGRSARKNKLIVLLHQDIYLPQGWDDRLIAQIAIAEKKFGPVGIAGVFGVVRSQFGAFERAGKVLDRRTLLSTPHALPASAESLDEIILAFPVQNGSIVGLEKELGFHMYGSEACLSAWEANQAAVVVDAPCLHNTESGYELDGTFVESAAYFAAKRSDSLPYATTCVEFKSSGQVSYW